MSCKECNGAKLVNFLKVQENLYLSQNSLKSYKIDSSGPVVCFGHGVNSRLRWTHLVLVDQILALTFKKVKYFPHDTKFGNSSEFWWPSLANWCPTTTQPAPDRHQTLLEWPKIESRLRPKEFFGYTSKSINHMMLKKTFLSTLVRSWEKTEYT